MVYITYIYGDLGDGLWNCFTHIIVTSTISPHSSPSQPSQFSYRLGTSTQHCFTNICLVVWNIFYFSIQLGRIIPTVFHIFQRGRYTTNQIWLGLCFTIVLPNIYPTFTQHLCYENASRLIFSPRFEVQLEGAQDAWPLGSCQNAWTRRVRQISTRQKGSKIWWFDVIQQEIWELFLFLKNMFITNWMNEMNHIYIIYVYI